MALGAFAASMVDAAWLAHTEDRVVPRVTLAPIGDTRTLGLSLAGWL